MRRIRCGWWALVLVLWLLAGGTALADTAFTARQSGPWEDPATWGHTGAPIPDVTIPGPHSTVTIPVDITVRLGTTPVHVAALTVQAGGSLVGPTAGTLHLTAEGDIVVDGQVLGGDGSWEHPAGNVYLRSLTGQVTVNGRVRGGHAAGDRPGGWVVLEADQGDVAIWGWVYGGQGEPGGWVWLAARAGVIRNRGEVRGGGTVLATARTVEGGNGRWLGLPDRTGGDTVLLAKEALFLNGRRTRVSGRRVFASAGARGLLDLQNVETMGILAEGDLWLLGGPETRLYLTGNRARFAPFHTQNGTVYLAVSPDRQYRDTDVTLTELVAGPVQVRPAQPAVVPVILWHTWQPAQPGQPVTWTFWLVNGGNGAGTVRLSAGHSAGWPVALSTDRVIDLASAASTPITLTLNVPPAASAGTRTTVTLTAESEDAVGITTTLEIPVVFARKRAFVPWLSRRGSIAGWPSPRAVPLPATVDLLWPGRERGAAVQDHTVLVVNTDPTLPVAGVDLAYWDGRRWVPIAMPSDMANLTEDGVWYTLWDASRLPLTQVYIRARVWSEDRLLNERVQTLAITHRPVAQATATFAADGRVTWDARGSTDLDDNIAAYAWDLGDGTRATGPIVTHTYAAGQYVVRLVVTDTTGLSDEAVYVLDTVARTWGEQTACGCTGLRLRREGPAPLPLPWEEAATATLGPTTALLDQGWLLRANLALEAALTPASNARACKVAQWGRLTWSWNEGGQTRQRAWEWAGQTFPADATAWGLLGYTQPSALLEAAGHRIRWVIGPGWGWRSLQQGLPPAALAGAGARLEGVFRAQVAGTGGACTCTWEVTIEAQADGPPRVTINGTCP